MDFELSEALQTRPHPSLVSCLLRSYDGFQRLIGRPHIMVVGSNE